MALNPKALRRMQKSLIDGVRTKAALRTKGDGFHTVSGEFSADVAEDAVQAGESEGGELFGPVASGTGLSGDTSVVVSMQFDNLVDAVACAEEFESLGVSNLTVRLANGSVYHDVSEVPQDIEDDAYKSADGVARKALRTKANPQRLVNQFVSLASEYAVDTSALEAALDNDDPDQCLEEMEMLVGELPAKVAGDAQDLIDELNSVLTSGPD